MGKRRSRRAPSMKGTTTSPRRRRLWIQAREVPSGVPVPETLLERGRRILGHRSVDTRKRTQVQVVALAVGVELRRADSPAGH